MGPWRNSIAFSAIVALISPPKPPVRGASWTTTTRPVFFADSRMAGSSSGTRGPKFEDLRVDPLRGRPLRSLEADVDHVPVRDQGDVGPLPPRLRGPEGDRVLPLRDVLPEGPVQLLRLEEEDGGRVADRGRHEPLRVPRGS